MPTKGTAAPNLKVASTHSNESYFADRPCIVILMSFIVAPHLHPCLYEFYEHTFSVYN